MYIEGIYLGTEIDSTFDNMMSSVADYTGSVKTDSPRSFLIELSQAVERAKIIIAIGELYGKNGLINIMSKGLDLPMTAVDWKKMGIAPSMNPSAKGCCAAPCRRRFAGRNDSRKR